MEDIPDWKVLSLFYFEKMTILIGLSKRDIISQGSNYAVREMNRHIGNDLKNWNPLNFK